MQQFRPYRLGRFDISRPWVMGILNVTPDSFWDGSRCDTQQAVERRVGQMLDEGADVIDIGAYSTRPGAAEVPVGDELARIEMAMGAVRRLAPGMVTSVDTFRACVAQHAVEHLGVDIVNDVSGGTLDSDMFGTVARLQVPYILMHMRGTPATMQQLTDYDNLVEDVADDLSVKLDALHDLGLCEVVIDPGFGFGQTVNESLCLLRDLHALQHIGSPILVGISRKRMAYEPHHLTPDNCLEQTLQLERLSIQHGAAILRVHDVAATQQMITDYT